MNVEEIRKAMEGRRVAGSGNTMLLDSVRMSVQRLAEMQGSPMTPQDARRVAQHVIRAAAQTGIYENEIFIALQAGIAGEYGNKDRRLLSSNVSGWITLYSGCNERNAAQHKISVGEAVAKQTANSVAADAMRRDFDENGLKRAWVSFIEDGRWTFREGYGAVLYNKIGQAAIRALLNSDQIASARVAARSALRGNILWGVRYRGMSNEDLDACGQGVMYFKANLARVYFETLRDKGLDINQNSGQDYEGQ